MKSGLKFVTDSLDLLSGTIKVRGKGKKERLCPLGMPATQALQDLLAAPLPDAPDAAARETRPVFINQRGQRGIESELIFFHVSAVTPLDILALTSVNC